MLRGTSAVSLANLALALGACVTPLDREAAMRTPVAGDSDLVSAFVAVGDDTGVPAELLAALAHVQTRMRIVSVTGDAAHGATRLGLYGLSPAELARGAGLAGVPDATAATDAEAGIRVAAALLRDAAPEAVTVEEFLAAMEPGQRSAVIAALARGIDAQDPTGHHVVVRALVLHASPGLATTQQALVGYEGAEWIPAYSGNYGTSDRGAGDIDHIVIHDTEGAYNGTLSWFRDPDAKVSAHYVIRSMDGHIAQMVDEKDVAWHDKCFNTTTIGIEHEGFLAEPELWYTEAMYVESAKLAADIADRYGIAKEKGPIVGHGEAPDCSDHTDPGPGWDWDHYIDLVRTHGAPHFDAADVSVVAPETMIAGERATVTVTITNRGSTTWTLDATRLGTALPQDRESALFVDGDWISPSRASGVDAAVEPEGTGTFTFDIVAPAVTEATLYDEAFQLTEEGVAWFGPEVHVVTTVEPAPEVDEGGCNAGGSGSGGAACAILALGVLVAPRRRRRRQ